MTKFYSQAPCAEKKIIFLKIFLKKKELKKIDQNGFANFAGKKITFPNFACYNFYGFWITKVFAVCSLGNYSVSWVNIPMRQTVALSRPAF